MTIILKPEQKRVLIEAINSGLAQTTEEALDQALDALRDRLPREAAGRWLLKNRDAAPLDLRDFHQLPEAAPIAALRKCWDY